MIDHDRPAHGPIDPLISDCDQGRLGVRARQVLIRAARRCRITRLSEITVATTLDGVEGCGPATFHELGNWADAERLRLGGMPAPAPATCPHCGRRIRPEETPMSDPVPPGGDTHERP